MFRPPPNHTHNHDPSPSPSAKAPSSDDASVSSYDSLGAHALPFAGRIGGNLAFCKYADKATPDATRLTNIRDSVDLPGFIQPIYWKAAVIECVGTGCQVFLSGTLANSLGKHMSTSSPLAVTCAQTLTTWATITLFLYAAAPASGGHLNPFITLSTYFAGLCTLPRMLFYVGGQILGAVAGAWWLKLGLGGSQFYFPQHIVGGCSIDFALIPKRDAFVLELGTYIVVVFLAYGVGLDPRQARIYGPAVGPVLVGAVVALAGFGTGNVRPGWNGVSLNPARCFGLMAANGNLSSAWVHWSAAITASVLNGFMYTFVPTEAHRKGRTKRPAANFGASAMPMVDIERVQPGSERV